MCLFCCPGAAENMGGYCSQNHSTLKFFVFITLLRFDIHCGYVRHWKGKKRQSPGGCLVCKMCFDYEADYILIDEQFHAATAII
jgi:hypothetical protein